MIERIKSAVIVGSGNVAWHMLKALGDSGIVIRQIVARNPVTARMLSDDYQVPFVTDPALMDRAAGIYILAVQDDEIEHAALSLKLDDQLLVHTSGFSDLAVLQGFSSDTGVIWPLQSLTTGKSVDYRQIPFFIEANNDHTLSILKNLAESISDTVISTESPIRKHVHLAAVIASNLSNHLYTIAASILEKQKIAFEVLVPLIRETAAKSALKGPVHNQTGPASRGDLKVIGQHLKMLEDEPSYRDIYKLITENIIQHRLNEEL